MAIEQNPLLAPYNLGEFELSNRVIMAPMTRSRAGEGNAPTELNAAYYKQRASAGLIISEGTQISEQGVGYPWTPGIHTEEQIEGWKKVTNAVHKADGRIFAQIWHVGRISHPYFHDGDLPVAPSAIKPEGQAFTPEGMKDFVEPRALETEEIPGIIEDYVQAAKNALEAGFDGVEIHGANGYLIDQFIQDGTNQRTDDYGGSVKNRARFALEVTEAVADAIGSKKVGIRLSPSGTFNDMYDSNSKHTFTYVINQLNQFDLAYLHLVEPLSDVSDMNNYLENVTSFFRNIYEGTIITCGAYDRNSGIKAIEQGTSDLVAYAKLFLANPDLPEKFAANAELNKPNSDTFYGGDETGYTDYPFMDEETQIEVA
ncbi:MAG: alkene reductase [Balneolaceae bacterium]|nr:alkene reductase [Balneolaceae bacterium]